MIDYNEYGENSTLSQFATTIQSMDSFISNLKNSDIDLDKQLELIMKRFETSIQNSTLWQQKKISEQTEKEIKARKKALDEEIKQHGRETAKAQELLKGISDATQKIATVKAEALQAEKRIEAAASGDTKGLSKASSERDKQKKIEEEDRKLKLQALEQDRERIKNSKDLDEKDKQQQLKKIDDDEKRIARQAQLQKKFEETLTNLGSNLAKLSDNIIKEAESIVDQYEATITTRLLGSGKTWDSTSGIITTNTITSTLVSTKTVLSNLSNLVNHGIAYNVEQRAFLESLKEEIATTFNSFDASLLRLIKLQQADSTIARMGMEAALNSTLNALYGDTSYLSNAASGVRSAILEATSLMNKEQAVETEFQIQKWLGAMSSVGVSESAISAIASALGYMGSGNYSQLSNSPIQTLLVQSLSGSNKSYGELLKEGLDSSNVNTLMKSMVEYLTDIATNTSTNNIIRSAYGNVYGLSVSDIEAIQNLTSSINTLADTNYNYSALQGVTQNLIGSATSRLSWNKQIQTLLSNLQLSTGLTTVDNPLLYLLYKAAQTSESITGGIALPAIMGNDLNTTIEQLVKIGVTGTSLVTTLIGSLLNGSAFGVNLNGWGATDTWLGGGVNLYSTAGKSSSGAVNASSSDMTQQLLEEKTNSDVTQQSIETSKEINEKAGASVESIYKALVNPSNISYLKTIDEDTTRLEAIDTNISDIKGDLTAIITALSELGIDNNVMNVNIQQVASQDVASDTGVKVSIASSQVDNFISAFVSRLGITNNDNMLKQKFTLQDLIDFFMETVGAEEGAGLNVNLNSMSNSISMSSLLQNEKYYSQTRNQY